MSDLHGVAEHLSMKAKVLDGDAADAFGRSAFNRYYYATYLTVRELLALIDASWESQSHATIPDLLEGALLKRLKFEANKQERLGFLAKPHEMQLIKQATQASSAIASVLRSAYSVRVVSDYQPNIKVIFQGNGFSMLDHSDLEAKNWKKRVEREKGILINISRELGVVS